MEGPRVPLFLGAVLLPLLAVMVCSCARTAFRLLESDRSPGLESDRSPGDGASEAMPWGEYTESVALPTCPPGNVLIVTDTTVDNDGGEFISSELDAGSTVSLVEAMWIAHNRPGPDTVTFDGALFPASAENTIHIADTVRFPMDAITEVCVDASGRGVVLQWPAGRDGVRPAARPGTVWDLGTGSLQMGLTLLNIAMEQSVFGSQVAGCRYGTDGTDVYGGARPWSVEIIGSTFGPFNVVAGDSLRVWRESTVIDNAFGFDPSSHNDIQTTVALQVQTQDAVIRDNVVAVTHIGIDVPWPNPGAREAVIERNIIRSANGVSGGVGIQVNRATLTIGPDNSFENIWSCISVTGGGTRITQNTFRGCGTPISYPVDAPPPSPSVTNTSMNNVHGECFGDGVVEVFVDLAGQASQFVGAASCSSQVWSLNWGVIPCPTMVTATFTTAMGETSPLSAPTALVLCL